MQKSELLNQILTDYLGANTLSDEAEAAVTAFCDYAVQWLATERPVGVGHTTPNMAIRMANGRELALFDAAEQAVVDKSVSVGITGQGGASVRSAGAVVIDASHAITGNQK